MSPVSQKGGYSLSLFISWFSSDYPLMIPFFRRFRLSLLTQTRFCNYLFYAFDLIVLV